MNEIELRLTAEDEAGERLVHVLIDGRDLLDRVKEVELPQATADGQPDLAGGYGALTAAEWETPPAQYGDGRATVLGCECGVAECWPLRVRITWRDDSVVWSDFEQPNRAWSYERLGPFVFAREQYAQAVARGFGDAKNGERGNPEGALGMTNADVADAGDPLADFIDAACVPLDAGHSSGTLERAEAILAAHPEVARAGIHAAAILGDDEGVRGFIAADPACATAKGGPRGWDALTYLCFSRYLRLDRARSDGFVRAARALLDAGASASTGWSENDHQPHPEWESALYGAAGVAHHAGVTRLLLERGADPNDGETTYHSPEGFDNEAMQLLVETGRLTPDSLTTLLIRKLDWTDYDGAAWLLAHGADPNHLSLWRHRPLSHSLARDNRPELVELLLDHGADPTLRSSDGRSAFEVAARMGRGDALDLFARRGFPSALAGDDAFLAAAARGDEERARALAAAEPGRVARLQAEDGGILIRFAGAGNTAAVRLLLDLGFDVALRGAGDRTALHVATWRERVDTVRLLLERGPPLEAADARGDTPLSLAVRALVEWSEWTPHDSTEIVVALLDAGADPRSVKPFPSGSAQADELLRRHGRES